MKMYTEAGNAKRAAKQITDKHPGVLVAAASVRADTAQPMFFPAVAFSGEHELALRTKMQDDLGDLVKFVNTADPLESLVEEPAPAPAPVKAKGKAKDKKPKEPKAKKTAAPKADKPKKETKTSIAIGLMSRKDGVTAAELADKLGWLPHTLRGFISLQNSNESRGIQTKREAGVTTYFIPQPEEGKN